MNSSTIFTSKRMGLDKKVWSLMILVCIGCVGLLSYKIIVVEPCYAIKLAVKSELGSYNDFHTKDALQFTAFMDGSKEVTWDFGDKSSIVAEGAAVTHTYTSSGDFVVTATINGKCYEALAVKINRVKLPEEIAPVYAGSAILPSNRFPQVGERVSFASNINAKQYEWSVEGDNQPAKKEKLATFIFDLPKSYTVILKLDNDPKQTYTVPIIVAPAPAASQPKPITRILVPSDYPYIPPPVDNSSQAPKIVETKPAPAPVEVKRAEPAVTVPEGPEQPKRIYYYKNKEQFADMLEEVISGDKNEKDFDKYLCDGGNTLVIENGKQTTFAGLCRILAGEKKKIISVDFLDITTFPDKSRCIKELKVKHEKKKSGLFNK